MFIGVCVLCPSVYSVASYLYVCFSGLLYSVTSKSCTLNIGQYSVRSEQRTADIFRFHGIESHASLHC